MALLSIWANSPDDVLSLSIRQIVAMAGDGRLLDNSECSRELRTFLSQVQSDKLAEYADFCLTSSFDKSGETLQDVVNELGRRLDYIVTNGLYQGVSNAIGNDGLWLSPEGHQLWDHRQRAWYVVARRSAARRPWKVSNGLFENGEAS